MRLFGRPGAAATTEQEIVMHRTTRTRRTAIVTSVVAAGLVQIAGPALAAGDEDPSRPPDSWNYYEACYGNDLIMDDDREYCVGYYLPV